MKTTLSLLAAAACALVLTGCGSDGSGADGGTTPSAARSHRTNHPASAATTTSAAQTSAVTTASSTSAATTGTPECTNDDVRVSYQHQGDASSHSYGFIVLTNTSARACWVRGYGGVSYAGDDGEQIGAAADRTAATPATVTLAPGGTAKSELAETSYGPYTANRCERTQAVALRVYIPDETDSQLVAHRLTVCANPRLHLLEHKPYVAG